MIADMHNDILTSGRGEKEIKAYLDRALKDCDVITMAAWTSEAETSVSSLSGTFEKYRCYEGGGENAGKAVFAVEDMGFLGADEESLMAFLGMPIAYAGLVWNSANCFGGGAFCGTGLTESGKRTARLFNSSRVALDFAHMNEKTFFEAAEVYDKPILCSHACFDACTDKNSQFYHIARARNINDAQIKAVVASGGLVGLAFVATFLNGTPSCTGEDVFRHIDYFVSKYGYAHLGIGTDYFGTSAVPSDIKEYKDFNTLAEKLSKAGYSGAVISAILCDNYKRFLDNLKNS